MHIIFIIKYNVNVAMFDIIREIKATTLWLDSYDLWTKSIFDVPIEE